MEMEVVALIVEDAYEIFILANAIEIVVGGSSFMSMREMLPGG